MSEVWRNEEHSMPMLLTAIGKLKALRTHAANGNGTVLGDLSLEEVDTIIDHVESTKGQFLMPDVPM